MNWKWVVRYWGAWAGVMILGMGWMKWQQRNFFRAGLERAMLTPAAGREIDEDPCKFETAGDPVVPDRRSVKIWLTCGDKLTINTLAWGVVRKSTAEGFLSELGRVNGFRVGETGNWECKVNGGKVTDWSQKIVGGDKIECVKNE